MVRFARDYGGTRSPARRPDFLSTDGFSSPCLLSGYGFVKWGAIMYALENIDFSDRLGFVVSASQPDEADSQHQTLDTKSSSLPTSALEEAVFGAA